MRYLDAMYGEVDIEEPVLLDLMQTRAMQRLRGVLPHGITALIGITRPVTRYEHSLGVVLLVRRLHAQHPERNAMQSKDASNSLQEQIAALLHDVSHTAFSHVIDYVVGGHDSQSYHCLPVMPALPTIAPNISAARQASSRCGYCLKPVRWRTG